MGAARILLVGVLLGAFAAPASAGDPALRGRVVYVSDGSVYVSSADGQNRWRLTRSSIDAAPAWSPDGSKVAFTRVEEHGVDLYVISTSGRSETLLARDIELGFDWSPDGSSIAFAKAVTAGIVPNARPHIHIVDVTTGVVEQVTRGDRSDTGPRFSPDGNEILFAGGHDSFPASQPNNSDIYSLRLARGRVTKLTDSPGADYDPMFSRDGSTIAFTSTRDTVSQTDGGSAAPEIYVMDRNGRSEDRVSIRPAAHDVGPQWSPDGKKLTYVSYRGDAAEGEGEIRVAAVTGGWDRALTASDEMMAWSPSWSRDGRWIVFVSSLLKDDGSASDTEITMVPSHGGKPRFLTDSDAFEWGPDWR